MLVERTIFWPGRSGTDAPLRRRSGRGKTGGGSLATGGAGRRRERYSRERGRKGCVSPRAGEGSHSGTLAGMGGPVAVPLPQPSCRGWRGRKAALGPVWRKAPQLQPRRRTAHDGEGDSSHGTFLKRAAGRSCRRGKGTCGRWQRRREGPSPGRSARSAPSVTKGAPRASAVMRAGLLDP